MKRTVWIASFDTGWTERPTIVYAKQEDALKVAASWAVDEVKKIDISRFPNDDELILDISNINQAFGAGRWSEVLKIFHGSFSKTLGIRTSVEEKDVL